MQINQIFHSQWSHQCLGFGGHGENTTVSAQEGGRFSDQGVKRLIDLFNKAQGTVGFVRGMCFLQEAFSQRKENPQAPRASSSHVLPATQDILGASLEMLQNSCYFSTPWDNWYLAVNFLLIPQQQPAPRSKFQPCRG